MEILFIIIDLPPSTVKAFSLFLKSPYHNSNKRLIQFLNKKLLHGDTMEEAHRKVFKGEQFNKQVFKNLLSELKKKYLIFLAIEELKTEDLLVDTLAHRKIRKDKHLVKVRNALLREDINKSSKLSLALKTEIINLHIHETIKKRSGNINELLEIDFRTYQSYLFLFRIEYLCNYIAIQQNAPNHKSNALLEEEIKNLQRPPINLSHTPLLNLYYLTFVLSKNPTIENYEFLKERFEPQLTTLHSDRIEFILGILTNYCIQQINRGKDKFSFDLFDLQLIHIKYNKDILSNDGFLINLVTIGCRIKRYRDVLNITTDNKQRISNNAFHYCTALIHYYKKDFDKAMDTLSQVQLTTDTYALNHKYLMIKMLAESDEIEAALSHLESLRIFLLRSKTIPSDRKRTHTNFIKYMKGIILLQGKRQSMSRAKFREVRVALQSRIISTQHLFNKEYLLNFLNKKKHT